MLAFLEQRFPHITKSEWLHRLQTAAVCDDEGHTLTEHTSYRAGCRLYYFRTLPSEERIPFEATVLWQDAHLLVVDKPHFLPVIPSGKYLRETLLVRLKNELKLPDLVPIHRTDRDTAGLVLFSISPDTRDAYHALFRNHQITKRYEAIAAWHPELHWPVRRESRIGPAQHFMQMCEVSGPNNAVTDIDVLEVHGAYARYLLQPVTGQRHQLRVHMSAMGLPLLHDGMYPALTPEGTVDFSRPLQLLAKSIAFVDPVLQTPRHFESRRALLQLTALPASHAPCTN
jgi:tRNA pseudouridine32 synthase/23S rRNA pseudouridine746 synthase